MKGMTYGHHRALHDAQQLPGRIAAGSDQTEPKSDRASLAIHEAGHAVAMRHFTIPLSDVRVYPASGCAPGQGGTTCDEAMVSALSEEKQAVIILAGFAADCHYDGDNVDWKEARDSRRYKSDSCKLDRLLQCRMPIDLADEDDEIIDRPLDEWLLTTMAFVADPAHWQAITALAEKLDQLHELSGEEAMAIIDPHLNGT
jgi:hypothetical protein